VNGRQPTSLLFETAPICNNKALTVKYLTCTSFQPNLIYNTVCQKHRFYICKARSFYDYDRLLSWKCECENVYHQHDGIT